MIQVEEALIDRLTETLFRLLNGEKVEPIQLPLSYPDNEIRQVYDYFNRFIEEFNDFSEFMYAISRGELNCEAPKGKLKILQSFKSYQANLKHLTWKTEQIAKGDFDHKVDFIGDFSVAFNEMTRQLKESFETIKQQNEQLQDANKVIAYEREKSDMLLMNILPSSIVEELKTCGTTTPQLYKDVVVFFSDIVGFSDQSSRIEPAVLIQELTSLFTAFDSFVDASYGERIKTIGDAYMAVWGMHVPLENCSYKAVKAALQMIDYVEQRNKTSEFKWKLRVGMHIGDVVGGVVGTSKFVYDIFGDTVNIASRLESTSEPMRINISERLNISLENQLATTPRGQLYAKGIGNINMYFVK